MEVFMSYYYTKTLENISFEDAIELITGKLKNEGFGVLTEINVTETLKKKIDVDFKNYRILGACNPPFAHKALLAEDKIGLMLPCNVVVEETDGKIEISAIKPEESMKAINNPKLDEVSAVISQKLQNAINSL